MFKYKYCRNCKSICQHKIIMPESRNAAPYPVKVCMNCGTTSGAELYGGNGDSRTGMPTIATEEDESYLYEDSGTSAAAVAGAPTNSVGAGNVAGVGIGPKGEPPGKRRRSMFPSIFARENFMSFREFLDFV